MRAWSGLGVPGEPACPGPTAGGEACVSSSVWDVGSGGDSVFYFKPDGGTQSGRSRRMAAPAVHLCLGTWFLLNLIASSSGLKSRVASKQGQHRFDLITPHCGLPRPVATAGSRAGDRPSRPGEGRRPRGRLGPLPAPSPGPRGSAGKRRGPRSSARCRVWAALAPRLGQCVRGCLSRGTREARRAQPRAAAALGSEAERGHVCRPMGQLQEGTEATRSVPASQGPRAPPRTPEPVGGCARVLA